ncbi:ATP-binding protein [Streptomyces sp. NPDC053431]|uniref:ATP-binding protein n=1 Tax=Streptomyces sp. NPDC053431 TaxID=3365703 RepID=UPI0037D350DE
MTRLQEAPPPGGDMDSSKAATRAATVASAQDDRQGTNPRDALPTMPSTFQATFLPAPERVSGIRQSAAIFLRTSGVPDQTVDDVVLLVSELVTNAVTHGRGEVSLRALAANGRVAITVSTESKERAVVREAGLEDESGRGMFLVAALADTWGIASGMTWCVLRYEPADSGSVAA